MKHPQVLQISQNSLFIFNKHYYLMKGHNLPIHKCNNTGSFLKLLLNHNME